MRELEALAGTGGRPLPPCRQGPMGEHSHHRDRRGPVGVYTYLWQSDVQCNSNLQYDHKFNESAKIIYLLAAFTAT
jgi:hypothetical protein